MVTYTCSSSILPLGQLIVCTPWLPKAPLNFLLTLCPEIFTYEQVESFCWTTFSFLYGFHGIPMIVSYNKLFVHNKTVFLKIIRSQTFLIDLWPFSYFFHFYLVSMVTVFLLFHFYLVSMVTVFLLFHFCMVSMLFL